MVILLFSEDLMRLTIKICKSTSCDTVMQCESSELFSWLKAQENQDIKKDTIFLVVLPESILRRICVSLPTGVSKDQQADMLQAYLYETFHEKMGLYKWHEIGEGSGLWSVCACSRTNLDNIAAVLKKYRRRYQFISQGDWILHQQADAIEDGYWGIEDSSSHYLLAIQEQRVVDVKYSALHSIQQLYEEIVLTHHRNHLQIKHAHQWQLLHFSEGYPNKQWQAEVFSQIENKKFLQDKKFLTLALCCVVFPLLMLMGLHGYEAQTMSQQHVKEVQEKSTTSNVVRSQYSVLLEGAYRVATPRIILQKHEASEGALLVNGRCQEPLDVAAYMKNLTEGQENITPVLIDLTKKVEKENTFYYEFTLHLSQTGEKAHES